MSNEIAMIAFASAPPIPNRYKRKAIGIEIAIEIAMNAKFLWSNKRNAKPAPPITSHIQLSASLFLMSLYAAYKRRGKAMKNFIRSSIF